jgi:hypothetical protein
LEGDVLRVEELDFEGKANLVRHKD